ncbi:MAG: acyl-CoA thioesterase [Geodermatophilaceae bacterium]|nr:acyl-CoA thioesterase [Geodermatophilaceae bacterium]MDQ3457648.1 acyl-CoA thioesterase [Actinomycetota bacterium]
MARHTYLCPMRWADMDAYGHINNTVYLAYLEQARVDVFFTKARGLGVESLNDGIVVAEHQIRYRRPISYGPLPLRIELWVSSIRAAAYTADYEIWDESGEAPQLATTARSVLAPFDMNAGRLRRLTAPEKAFLEDYRDHR